MSNVVLLVVDTLRDKELQEERTIAPFLSTMAEDQIKLDNYYSNASWTAPAHASIFTGELPHNHGTTTFNPFFKSQNRVVDFFKENGFYTVGFSENQWVSGASGYGESFDEFIHFSNSKRGGEAWKKVWENDSEFNTQTEKWLFFAKKALRDRDLESFRTLGNYIQENKLRRGEEADYNPGQDNKVFDQIINELKKEERDSFVFANIMAVHAPYRFNERQKVSFMPELTTKRISEVSDTLPLWKYLLSDKEESFVDDRRRAYRASVSYVDSKIEELYKRSPKDTVFIILGDHGEVTGEYEFGGKPLIGHHLGTFKELLDVPCYILSKRELDIDISPEKMYSHRDILEVAKLVLGQEANPGKQVVKAEYRGLNGFLQFKDEEIPSKIESILNRKSFCVMDKKAKYDLTSEGGFPLVNERSYRGEEVGQEGCRGTKE